MADNLPLPFGQDSNEMSFEQYKNRAPLQVTSGDSTGAAFDLANQETAMGIAARYKASSELASQGARKLQPEEANARYPDMPTKWKEPVDPYLAQQLYDKHQENTKLQAMIEAGPQDPWTKLKNFGAGLLAHAMDPVELGAGMIAGWGAGAVVARTAWGAATATAIKAGTAPLATRTAMNVIEAGAGNLIQSTALETASHVTTNAEMNPEVPTLYEGMQNVAVNTFFGSLLHVGIKEASYNFGAAANRVQRMIRNTSPEADLAIARGTFSQVERGIKPNPDVMLEALAKETDVKGGNYSFRPDQVSEPGKKFYVPSDSVNEFDPAKVRPVGDQHGSFAGEGSVKMTDNLDVAGAAANRGMADSPGVVFEVEAKDLRPINIHEPLPENAQNAFREATNGVLSEKEFSTMSPKDMLSAIWDKIDEGAITHERILKLQDDLKAAGYNAFQGDGSNVMGFDHSQHNDMTVFDHEILKPTDQFDAANAPRNDPDPQTIKNELARQQDAGQQMGIDPRKVEAFDQKLIEADSSGLTKSDNMKFLDDNMQAQVEHLETFDKQGLLGPAERAELEQIKELQKQPEVYKTLAKALGGCIGKYG